MIFKSNIYFLELKFKLFYSFLLYSITSFFCYLNINPILYIFSEYLLKNIKSNRFIFTNILQIFFTYLELTLYLGFLFSLPFILLNIFSFFISSFYVFEFIFFFKIFIFFLFNFFFGMLFIKFIIIPNFLQFFFFFESINVFFPLHFEAKFDEYFKSILFLTLNFLIIFQIPTLILICNFYKIKILFLDRKYMYMFFFIFSAICSPPDLFFQIFLWVFFIIVFEIFKFFKILFSYFRI